MTSVLDAKYEVTLGALDASVTELAKQLMTTVVAVEGPSASGPHDWAGAVLGPVARYLRDPMYQAGNQPAYIELRVQTADTQPQPRGYILISLTQEDRPIPEFATAGVPKTDRVLTRVAGGQVARFLRYVPAYLAAEDAAGNLLGYWGTTPFARPDIASSAAGTATSGLAGAVPIRAADAAPSPRVGPSTATIAAAYATMKKGFVADPDRLKMRPQRVAEASAAWGLARGIDTAAAVKVQVGQTQIAFGDRKFTAASTLTAWPAELFRLTPLPTGGVQITGVATGLEIVRLQDVNGRVDFQPIAVVAAPGTLTTYDAPVTRLCWFAGTGWDGDQRQYDQGDKWCPAVGCGPTALAMLLGWWDANGVPAAFYRLDEGQGNATSFRFNYSSLRDSDAPKSTADAATDATYVDPVYSDLHDLCNTFCWVTGDGSTMPDQLTAAFQQYVARIQNPQPSPQNEYGDQFVDVVIQEDFHAPGVFSDWEGGGKMVAHGIQAGQPGIIGSYVGSHVVGNAHYPLAYAYIIAETQSGNTTTVLGQYFKCNMGWGPGSPPEFYPCEEVWGGLTAKFTQKSLPMSADDGIAATFRGSAGPGGRVSVFIRTTDLLYQISSANQPQQLGWPAGYTPLPEGTFRSGPAACVAADGQRLHVVGMGSDNRYWHGSSADGGATWYAWLPIGDGVFTSMPTIALSGDGNNVHVFGRGNDNHIWRAYSSTGGAGWDYAWGQLDADGVFTSAPAAAISTDGRIVHVVGRGNDNRYWRAYSSDGASTWELWNPIGDGVFSSNPAAAVSADGSSLHIFGRGLDGRIWRAHTPDAGATWDALWGPVGDGIYISSPAVAMSPDGATIHVFGVGTDRHVYRSTSTDGGQTWSGPTIQSAGAGDPLVF
ncbi:MAG: hypothetical protein WCC28_23625 [Mycobacterium sp.]|uniref:hypothetical protein n=1 Tax=Mycobacterium sp. TaxID=1785 RepID=UPI003C760A3D